MGKSKAKVGKATKYSLKPKDDAEKIEQIQQILKSSSPTNSVWEPTDEEIEILQTHVSDGGTADDEVKQLESKLNSIYDVIPPVLHHCWSRNFSKKYEDVSARVQSLYGRRYDALQRQHTVSQSLLQLRYPQLHQYAVGEGLHKGIEFDSIRSRLSQDVTNTAGKNWLQKMHGLLTNTIGRNKAAVDWGSDGDLVTPPPSDSDDGSVVEIDVHRAGKGEVKSDNVETPSDKTVSSSTMAIALGGSGKRSSSSLSSSSSPSPYASAAKRSKSDSGNDDGMMADADIDAIIRKLGDTDRHVNVSQDKVNNIFACIRRSNVMLSDEYNALHDKVVKALSSVSDLQDQRVRTEKSKEDFLASHSRSVRAYYDTYVDSRKLLYSFVFWNSEYGNGAQRSSEERRAAIRRYYDGTHPYCPNGVQPLEPNVTIEGTLLLTKEDTETRMRQLVAEFFDHPQAGGVDGVSLLRLPSRIQSQIEGSGHWPIDGLGECDLPNDLVDAITKANAAIDQLHDVSADLDNQYQFLLNGVTTPDTNDVTTPDGVGTAGTDGVGEDEVE